MKITNREHVREGDIVTWGAMGYHHSGPARMGPGIYDGEEDLTVNGGLSWWSNFLWAERA